MLRSTSHRGEDIVHVRVVSAEEKNQAGSYQAASFVLTKHLPISYCPKASRSYFLQESLLDTKNLKMGKMGVWSRTKDPSFLHSLTHSFITPRLASVLSP